VFAGIGILLLLYCFTFIWRT